MVAGLQAVTVLSSDSSGSHAGVSKRQLSHGGAAPTTAEITGNQVGGPSVSVELLCSQAPLGAPEEAVITAATSWAHLPSHGQGSTPGPSSGHDGAKMAAQSRTTPTSPVCRRASLPTGRGSGFLSLSGDLARAWGLGEEGAAPSLSPPGAPQSGELPVRCACHSCQPLWNVPPALRGSPAL